MLRIAQIIRSIALTRCTAVLVPTLVVTTSPTLAAPCTNPDALGTSRTVVIDPAEHIRLGAIQYRETLPLADHEVVLTFDDGPLPPYSNRILDILASECVKATYFLVGSMAKAHPRVVQRIAAEGHTIGTHSRTHPFTFNTMDSARMRREVQGGITLVSAALGGREPAPFFRIPGLLRASRVEFYLATQGLMTWSADIVSDDWRHISADEIARRTLARLEARGKGMVLLHDIHRTTALALPKLLRALKARGYRIVHVVPASHNHLKTATLPDQWLVRRAGRQIAAVKMPRAKSEASAATGAEPNREKHGKRRPMAQHSRRAPRAHLPRRHRSGAVTPDGETSAFFSALLPFPEQMPQ